MARVNMRYCDVEQYFGNGIVEANEQRVLRMPARDGRVSAEKVFLPQVEEDGEAREVTLDVSSKGGKTVDDKIAKLHADIRRLKSYQELMKLASAVPGGTFGNKGTGKKTRRKQPDEQEDTESPDPDSARDEQYAEHPDTEDSTEHTPAEPAADPEPEVSPFAGNLGSER